MKLAIFSMLGVLTAGQDGLMAAVPGPILRPRKILSAATQTRVKFHMIAWLNNHLQNPPDGKAFLDVVGELVRFVGHDFMSDFVVDGCIDFHHAENQGLDFAIETFYSGFDSLCSPFGVSEADCGVLLSEAIFDFTSAIGRPGLTDNDKRSSLLQTPWPLGKDLQTCPDPEDSDEEAVFDPECIYANGLGIPGALFMQTATGRITTPIGQCKAGSQSALATHRGPNAPLPKPKGGGPPVGLSDNIDFAELVRVLGGGEGNWLGCGMEGENVVAMMGVHSIGRASVINTGFKGFWVNPEKESACEDEGRKGTFGCQASLFDNRYYKDFFNMGWRKKKIGRGWECIENSWGMDFENFGDLHGISAPDLGSSSFGPAVKKEGACFKDSLRLAADMIILFDLDGTEEECTWVPNHDGTKVQSSCKLRPELWEEVLEYAQSDKEWLTSFREAWKIMVDCNHQRLFAPPEEKFANGRAVRIAEGFYRQFQPWVEESEYA